MKRVIGENGMGRERAPAFGRDIQFKTTPAERPPWTPLVLRSTLLSAFGESRPLETHQEVSIAKEKYTYAMPAKLIDQSTVQERGTKWRLCRERQSRSFIGVEKDVEGLGFEKGE